MDVTVEMEALRGDRSTVTVPVTLKIRTGWAADRKTAPTIARIAEDAAGAAALRGHARLTRTGRERLRCGLSMLWVTSPLPSM